MKNLTIDSTKIQHVDELLLRIVYLESIVGNKTLSLKISHKIFEDFVSPKSE